MIPKMELLVKRSLKVSLSLLTLIMFFGQWVVLLKINMIIVNRKITIFTGKVKMLINSTLYNKEKKIKIKE